ncbi:DUF2807 domain-containing protein [Pseudomonas aeruginosa]|nr:DUF2807 domain-containing protein [Pseudomonas aeruginosa]
MNNLLLTSASQSESAWDRAESYVKEERPMRAVRKIVVKGALDVVFFRANEPRLVVAVEDQKALANVTTRFEGDKLVIEQRGSSISINGGSIIVTGSGNIVAGGTIYENGIKRSGSGVVNQGLGIVGIALPEAPSLSLKGAGDATLYDLQQQALSIAMKGAGNIRAFGQVSHLEAELSGAGNVDARNLIADTATLLVSGAGNIKAHVIKAVKAKVSGCGDIVVRGNPAQREKSVSGVGNIKFK